MKTKIKSFAIDMSVTIIMVGMISLTLMATGLMDEPTKEHRGSSFQPTVSFLDEYITPSRTFKI